jgi:hypothetical protein
MTEEVLREVESRVAVDALEHSARTRPHALMGKLLPDVDDEMLRESAGWYVDHVKKVASDTLREAEKKRGTNVAALKRARDEVSAPTETGVPFGLLGAAAVYTKASTMESGQRPATVAVVNKKGVVTSGDAIAARTASALAQVDEVVGPGYFEDITLKTLASLGTIGRRMSTQRGICDSRYIPRELPLFTFEHENAILVEANLRFRIGDTNIIISLPKCYLGTRCVGNTVTGRVDAAGEPCPMTPMAYMTPEELREAISEGVLPTDINRRACLLCMRFLAMKLVLTKRAHSKQQNLSAKGGYTENLPILPFYNSVSPGQYVPEEVMTPGPGSGTGNAFVMFRPVVLRWVKHVVRVGNCVQHTAWFIDQSKLFHRGADPLPGCVFYVSSEAAIAASAAAPLPFVSRTLPEDVVVHTDVCPGVVEEVGAEAYAASEAMLTRWGEYYEEVQGDEEGESFIPGFTRERLSEDCSIVRGAPDAGGVATVVAELNGTSPLDKAAMADLVASGGGYTGEGCAELLGAVAGAAFRPSDF